MVERPFSRRQRLINGIRGPRATPAARDGNRNPALQTLSIQVERSRGTKRRRNKAFVASPECSQHEGRKSRVRQSGLAISAAAQTAAPPATPGCQRFGIQDPNARLSRTNTRDDRSRKDPGSNVTGNSIRTLAGAVIAAGFTCFRETASRDSGQGRLNLRILPRALSRPAPALGSKYARSGFICLPYSRTSDL